jgi:hypothetical protein
MNENIVAAERQKLKQFTSLKPWITEELERGIKPLEIAECLEHKTPYPLKMLYSWVISVESELEVNRQKSTVRGMILFWLGCLFTITGITLQLFLFSELAHNWISTFAAILVIFGLALGIPGISLASRGSKFINKTQTLDF